MGGPKMLVIVGKIIICILSLTAGWFIGMMGWFFEDKKRKALEEQRAAEAAKEKR